MGRATLKIVLSLIGAGVVGFCLFVLLEAMPSGSHAPNAGRVLFRFQLASMLAMGVFAGLAIVIYVRLSRNPLNDEPKESRTGSNRNSLRKR
jgi:hypothetical protein